MSHAEIAEHAGLGVEGLTLEHPQALVEAQMGDRKAFLRATFDSMLTARSLTRADLARRAGLNESTIGLVYRGERAMPEDWVDKIAAALRLGPADSMRLVIAGMASRLSDASAALLLSLYKTHTELEPLARDLEERIKALETYDDRLRRRESVVSDKEQAIAQREQLVAKRESLVAEREAAVRDAANEISSGMGQYWQQQGEGGDPAPSGA